MHSFLSFETFLKLWTHIKYCVKIVNCQKQRQALCRVAIWLSCCTDKFYNAQLTSLSSVPDSVALWFSLGKEGMEWHGRETSASATHFLSINKEKKWQYVNFVKSGRQNKICSFKYQIVSDPKPRVLFVVFKFLCVDYLAFWTKRKTVFQSTKLVHFNLKQIYLLWQNCSRFMNDD